MNSLRLHIKLFLLFVTMFFIINECRASKQPNIFVKCIFSKDEFYSHEFVTADFWLYSDNPDIQYINELKAPLLNKRNEFAQFTKISKYLQPKVESIDGKQYYVFPVGSYMVMMENPGKYEFSGGEYQVGMNVPTGYVDPFYGGGRYYETVVNSASMIPSHFKVLKLPEMKSEGTFSGAVGDFKISTIVPPGDIFVNEDATVIVTIQGKGIIPDDILPEYQEAFGKGNKLKSFIENSELFADGEDVVCRKNLEFIFVPEEIDNCEIGRIRFEFFNPTSKRYEVIESEPVKVEIKSSAIKIKPVYI